jgi:hypothetical protein
MESTYASIHFTGCEKVDFRLSDEQDGVAIDGQPYKYRILRLGTRNDVFLTTEQAIQLMSELEEKLWMATKKAAKTA